jgi:predicted nucleotidyltransferase component of viral defense system
MDSIDYKELYLLQDKVLEIIFAVENGFYLTGGTCLSRFYQEKRYSDDLDFFTHNSSRFGYAIKNITTELLNSFSVVYEVEAKDFVRIKIDDTLQVDFVNDRIKRYKEPKVLDNGYKIDTIENILSNKITAVLGRDNPKDIFDIYLINQFYTINWREILTSAQEKLVFSIDDLIIRLKSFPPKLLQNINLVDKTFLDNFESNFELLTETIQKET